MKLFSLIFASVSLAALGQILLKKGMIRVGELTVLGIWPKLIGIFSQFYVFLGFSCFGLGSVLWLVVISRAEISYAYPMISLAYVMVLFASALFLGEHVSLMRVIGVILICAGVFFISQS